MGPMPTYVRALLVGTLFLLLGSCAEERRQQPIAKDGILDLSGWDFEKDGIVELKDAVHDRADLVAHEKPIHGLEVHA